MWCWRSGSTLSSTGLPPTEKRVARGRGAAKGALVEPFLVASRLEAVAETITGIANMHTHAHVHTRASPASG